MNKFKIFNPVNIQVKKLKHPLKTEKSPISNQCHYCKFLLESCKCDDQMFYEKYMTI